MKFLSKLKRKENKKDVHKKHIETQELTISKLRQIHDDVLYTVINIGKGHFEITFDASKATDDLSQAVIEVVATLNKQNVKELKTSVKLSMQASEVLSSVSFVTADSRDISAVMTTISAAVEELNISAQQIADITEQIAGEANEAREHSQTGLEATENAVKSMHEIQKSVSTTLERVSQLMAASEEIGSILEVIEAIAAKTNLLALNATIEAARAGEAGKGFAVVAGEVKALSAQTAKATEQIRDQVSSVQEDVKNISEAINTTSEAVEDGSSNIESSVTGIHEMVKRIEEVAVNISNTSASVTEQTSATQEVARSVSVVEDKSKQNQVNAEKAFVEIVKTEEVLKENFEVLEKKNIPRSIVEFAKSDHFAWKRKLAEMFSTDTGLTSDGLSSHKVCRLGKWYTSIDDPVVISHPAFAKLDTPHSNVHTHGKKVAEALEAGDRVAAMKEYAEMDKASKEVVVLLEELSQALLNDNFVQQEEQHAEVKETIAARVEHAVEHAVENAIEHVVDAEHAVEHAVHNVVDKVSHVMHPQEQVVENVAEAIGNVIPHKEQAV